MVLTPEAAEARLVGALREGAAEEAFLTEAELTDPGAFANALINNLPAVAYALHVGLPAIGWKQAVKNQGETDLVLRAMRQWNERARVLLVQLVAGAITLETFYALMAQAFRQHARNAFLAGKRAMGNLSPMTAQDITLLDDTTADDGLRLDAFLRNPATAGGLGGMLAGMVTDPSNFLGSGLPGDPFAGLPPPLGAAKGHEHEAKDLGKFATRVETYGDRIRAMAPVGEMAALADIPGDASMVWWTLGGADHCVDCLALSDSSPFYASALSMSGISPGSGHTRCGVKCHCSLEYDVPSVVCADIFGTGPVGLTPDDLLESADGTRINVWVAEAAACANPVSVDSFASVAPPLPSIDDSEAFAWEEDVTAAITKPGRTFTMAELRALLERRAVARDAGTALERGLVADPEGFAAAMGWLRDLMAHRRLDDVRITPYALDGTIYHAASTGTAEAIRFEIGHTTAGLPVLESEFTLMAMRDLAEEARLAGLRFEVNGVTSNEGLTAWLDTLGASRYEPGARGATVRPAFDQQLGLSKRVQAGVSPEPSFVLPEVDALPAWPELSLLKDDTPEAVKALGGNQAKRLLVDPTGQRWIFRIEGASEDAAAYRVGQRLGLRMPPVQEVTYDGIKGSLTPLLADVQNLYAKGPLTDTGFFDWTKLKPDQASEALSQSVLDFVLGNIDAHEGNWLVDKAGDLWGIDRGRAIIGAGVTPKNVRGFFMQAEGIIRRDPNVLRQTSPDDIARILDRLDGITGPEYIDLIGADAVGRVVEPFGTDADRAARLLERKAQAREGYGELFRQLVDDRPASTEWKAWAKEGGTFTSAPIRPSGQPERLLPAPPAAQKPLHGIATAEKAGTAGNDLAVASVGFVPPPSRYLALTRLETALPMTHGNILEGFDLAQLNAITDRAEVLGKMGVDMTLITRLGDFSKVPAADRELGIGLTYKDKVALNARHDWKYLAGVDSPDTVYNDMGGLFAHEYGHVIVNRMGSEQQGRLIELYKTHAATAGKDLSTYAEADLHEWAGEVLAAISTPGYVPGTLAYDEAFWTVMVADNKALAATKDGLPGPLKHQPKPITEKPKAPLEPIGPPKPAETNAWGPGEAQQWLVADSPLPINAPLVEWTGAVPAEPPLPDLGATTEAKAAARAQRDAVTKTYQDVIDGKAPAAFSWTAKDAKEAKDAGLTVTKVGDSHIITKGPEDAKPYLDYLEAGGKTGDDAFWNLMGYSAEDLTAYDAYDNLGKSLRLTAGVVMVEPDGRMWILAPKGRFAGYENTVIKGGVDKGESTAAAAIREMREEAGFSVELDSYLGDYINSDGNATARMYIGHRTGGGPLWAHEKETHKVRLLTADEARAALKRYGKPDSRDQAVLSDAVAALEGKPGAPVFTIPVEDLPEFTSKTSAGAATMGPGARDGVSHKGPLAGIAPNPGPNPPLPTAFGYDHSLIAQLYGHQVESPASVKFPMNTSRWVMPDGTTQAMYWKVEGAGAESRIFWANSKKQVEDPHLRMTLHVAQLRSLAERIGADSALTGLRVNEALLAQVPKLREMLVAAGGKAEYGKYIDLTRAQVGDLLDGLKAAAPLPTVAPSIPATSLVPEHVTYVPGTSSTVAQSELQATLETLTENHNPAMLDQTHLLSWTLPSGKKLEVEWYVTPAPARMLRVTAFPSGMLDHEATTALAASLLHLEPVVAANKAIKGIEALVGPWADTGDIELALTDFAHQTGTTVGKSSWTWERNDLTKWANEARAGLKGDGLSVEALLGPSPAIAEPPLPKPLNLLDPASLPSAKTLIEPDDYPAGLSGGVSSKRVLQDPTTGSFYLFKEGGPTGATESREVAAQALGRDLGFNVPAIKNDEYLVGPGQLEKGSLQVVIPNVHTLTTYAPGVDYSVPGTLEQILGSLTPGQMKELTDQSILDFITWNIDTHSSNWLIDDTGKLWGIDRNGAMSKLSDLPSDDVRTFYSEATKNPGGWALMRQVFDDPATTGILEKVHPDELKATIDKVMALSDAHITSVVKPHLLPDAPSAQIRVEKVLERRAKVADGYAKAFAEMVDKMGPAAPADWRQWREGGAAFDAKYSLVADAGPAVTSVKVGDQTLYHEYQDFKVGYDGPGVKVQTQVTASIYGPKPIAGSVTPQASILWRRNGNDVYLLSIGAPHLLTAQDLASHVDRMADLFTANPKLKLLKMTSEAQDAILAAVAEPEVYNAFLTGAKAYAGGKALDRDAVFALRDALKGDALHAVELATPPLEAMPIPTEAQLIEQLAGVTTFDPFDLEDPAELTEMLVQTKPEAQSLLVAVSGAIDSKVVKDGYSLTQTAYPGGTVDWRRLGNTVYVHHAVADLSALKAHVVRLGELMDKSPKVDGVRFMNAITQEVIGASGGVGPLLAFTDMLATAGAKTSATGISIKRDELLALRDKLVGAAKTATAEVSTPPLGLAFDLALPAPVPVGSKEEYLLADTKKRAAEAGPSQARAQALADHGQFYSLSPYEAPPGKPAYCTYNVGRAIADGLPDGWSVAVGYWGEGSGHTWLVDELGRAVDPTGPHTLTPRLGITMPPEYAKGFLKLQDAANFAETGSEWNFASYEALEQWVKTAQPAPAAAVQAFDYKAAGTLTTKVQDLYAKGDLITHAAPGDAWADTAKFIHKESAGGTQVVLKVEFTDEAKATTASLAHIGYMGDQLKATKNWNSIKLEADAPAGLQELFLTAGAEGFDDGSYLIDKGDFIALTQDASYEMGHGVVDTSLATAAPTVETIHGALGADPITVESLIDGASDITPIPGGYVRDWVPEGGWTSKHGEARAFYQYEWKPEGGDVVWMKTETMNLKPFEQASVVAAQLRYIASDLLDGVATLTIQDGAAPELFNLLTGAGAATQGGDVILDLAQAKQVLKALEGDLPLEPFANATVLPTPAPVTTLSAQMGYDGNLLKHIETTFQSDDFVSEGGTLELENGLSGALFRVDWHKGDSGFLTAYDLHAVSTLMTPAERTAMTIGALPHLIMAATGDDLHLAVLDTQLDDAVRDLFKSVGATQQASAWVLDPMAMDKLAAAIIDDAPVLPAPLASAAAAVPLTQTPNPYDYWYTDQPLESLMGKGIDHEISPGTHTTDFGGLTEVGWQHNVTTGGITVVGIVGDPKLHQQTAAAFIAKGPELLKATGSKFITWADSDLANAEGHAYLSAAGATPGALGALTLTEGQVKTAAAGITDAMGLPPVQALAAATVPTPTGLIEKYEFHVTEYAALGDATFEAQAQGFGKVMWAPQGTSPYVVKVRESPGTLRWVSASGNPNLSQEAGLDLIVNRWREKVVSGKVTNIWFDRVDQLPSAWQDMLEAAGAVPNGENVLQRLALTREQFLQLADNLKLDLEATLSGTVKAAVTPGAGVDVPKLIADFPGLHGFELNGPDAVDAAVAVGWLTTDESSALYLHFINAQPIVPPAAWKLADVGVTSAAEVETAKELATYYNYGKLPQVTYFKSPGAGGAKGDIEHKNLKSGIVWTHAEFIGPVKQGLEHHEPVSTGMLSWLVDQAVAEGKPLLISDHVIAILPEMKTGIIDHFAHLGAATPKSKIGSIDGYLLTPRDTQKLKMALDKELGKVAAPAPAAWPGAASTVATPPPASVSAVVPPTAAATPSVAPTPIAPAGPSVGASYGFDHGAAKGMADGLDWSDVGHDVSPTGQTVAWTTTWKNGTTAKWAEEQQGQARILRVRSLGHKTAFSAGPKTEAFAAAVMSRWKMALLGNTDLARFVVDKKALAGTNIGNLLQDAGFKETKEYWVITRQDYLGLAHAAGDTTEPIGFAVAMTDDVAHWSPAPTIPTSTPAQVLPTPPLASAAPLAPPPAATAITVGPAVAPIVPTSAGQASPSFIYGYGKPAIDKNSAALVDTALAVDAKGATPHELTANGLKAGWSVSPSGKTIGWSTLEVPAGASSQVKVDTAFAMLHHLASDMAKRQEKFWIRPEVYDQVPGLRQILIDAGGTESSFAALSGTAIQMTKDQALKLEHALAGDVMTGLTITTKDVSGYLGFDPLAVEKALSGDPQQTAGRFTWNIGGKKPSNLIDIKGTDAVWKGVALGDDTTRALAAVAQMTWFVDHGIDDLSIAYDAYAAIPKLDKFLIGAGAEVRGTSLHLDAEALNNARKLIARDRLPVLLGGDPLPYSITDELVAKGSDVLTAVHSETIETGGMRLKATFDVGGQKLTMGYAKTDSNIFWQTATGGTNLGQTRAALVAQLHSFTDQIAQGAGLERLDVSANLLKEHPNLRTVLRKYGGKDVAGSGATESYITLNRTQVLKLRKDLDAEVAAFTPPGASQTYIGQQAALIVWPTTDELSVTVTTAQAKAKLGGQTAKAIFTDKAGNQWLFKPGASGRGAATDSAAAKLAELLGLNVPPVKTYTLMVDGKLTAGSLQKMLPKAKGMREAGIATAGQLNPEQTVELLRHSVLDWVVANDDAHMGNWLIDENGKLWAIDKSRGWESFGGRQDVLNTASNGNGGGKPWLFQFWSDAKKDPSILSKVKPQDLAPTLRKLRDIPESSYERLVAGIAPLTRNPKYQGKPAQMVADMVKRKREAAQDLERYFAGEVKAMMADPTLRAKVPKVWSDWVTSGGRFNLDSTPRDVWMERRDVLNARFGDYTPQRIEDLYAKNHLRTIKGEISSYFGGGAQGHAHGQYGAELIRPRLLRNKMDAQVEEWQALTEWGLLNVVSGKASLSPSNDALVRKFWDPDKGTFRLVRTTDRYGRDPAKYIEGYTKEGMRDMVGTALGKTVTVAGGGGVILYIEVPANQVFSGWIFGHGAGGIHGGENEFLVYDARVDQIVGIVDAYAHSKLPVSSLMSYNGPVVIK